MFTNRMLGMFTHVPRWEGDIIKSIDLLEDSFFVDDVDHYSIRLHETKRPHFDIVFGSIKVKDDKIKIDFSSAEKFEGTLVKKYWHPWCFDFVIGGVAPKELNKPRPALSDIIQFRLDKGASTALMLPQDAHPAEPYLIFEEGEGDTIPEGEYGAGKWTITTKGNARLKVIQQGKRIHHDLYLDVSDDGLMLEGISTKYTFYGSGPKWFINITH